MEARLVRMTRKGPKASNGWIDGWMAVAMKFGVKLGDGSEQTPKSFGVGILTIFSPGLPGLVFFSIRFLFALEFFTETCLKLCP